ncbi:MAG TPA: GntR family transcriptional regulator [Xanthobacteraceae bacterium]|jgi:DNA-binding GntR family transcriptional regulator
MVSYADAQPDVLGASPKSLSDQAYCRLRDMILTGELPGNTPLQERRLAEALEISRTPIREALSRLESEGMVIRQGGRFPVVRQWTVQQYIEVLNVRRVLEMEAAGLAAGRVPAADAARVQTAIHELMLAPKPNAAQHWSCDDMVHSLVSEGCGNGVLAELVRDLRRRTRMFDFTMLPERFKPGCLEHLEILDAVTKGEAARARTLMANHIDNVKSSILSKLQQL